MGFALGFLNTYLFAREGGFSQDAFGLVSLFVAVANIMFSLAAFGMPSFIIKFFPYYNERLATRDNDMLTIALTTATIGFGLVTLLGLGFKELVLSRFNNAPLLRQYYYWIFPFGYGYTIFMVLEPFGWQQKVPVLTNFLKELLSRLIVLVLLVLATAGIIASFSTFVHLYAFFYLVVAIALLWYFLKTDRARIVFKKSKVTERFKHQILKLCSFIWGGNIILNVANVFDSIVIAAVLPEGLALVAVYTLAQNISSLIQAPQRGIVAAAIGPLSKAWKEKDYERIQLIYQRSSINQLLFSCAMFALIWLNFEDGVYTFRLQEAYLQAKWVFLFIGLYRVIDMGTGLNAQIIGTSTYWKFEFVSGLILLALAIPLNYWLTKSLGLIGPAISNLIAFTVYNAVRFGFLYRKFKMQPFTKATIYALLMSAGCFAVTYYFFNDRQGFLWIIARSTLFVILFGVCTYLMKLTPDLSQVMDTVKGRFKKKEA